MLRDIFTNKWIIGGFLLLIIIACGCYFWYQHSLVDDRKAAADAAEYARLLENQKAKQEAATETETTSTKAPAESISPTVEKPSTDTNSVMKDVEPTQAQTDAAAKTTEMSDVPVSPHGFGAYPEIPEAMNIPKDKVHLYWESTWENPRQELLARVQIKLYQQGIKATGVTYKRNGLIYPIIKGVRYIEWDTVEYPDGSVERYVSRSTGHPDDNFMRGADGHVLESDIPSYLTIYTYPDGGIDPYQFLNLPKE